MLVGEGAVPSFFVREGLSYSLLQGRLKHSVRSLVRWWSTCRTVIARVGSDQSGYAGLDLVTVSARPRCRQVTSQSVSTNIDAALCSAGIESRLPDFNIDVVAGLG